MTSRAARTLHRLAPLLVATLAAGYFGLFLTYGFNLEDEGLMLSQAARTAHGQMPYVDFDTGYTPGVFYLNAAIFRLFGESVVPVRCALVLINSAAVGLIFALARARAGAVLAAAAALGYATALPVFTGQFASFNVPYPAWHAGLAFLATQAALDRHLRRGGRRWLVVAGVFAGVAFSFKPNAGALAVLACGLTLGIVSAGAGDRDRLFARILLGSGIAAIVGIALVDFPPQLHAIFPGFAIIAVAPLTLVVGRLGWSRGTLAEHERLPVAIGLVAAGALLPTAPWIGPFFLRLGTERFLHDVLLLGSGAENLYGTPYPLPVIFPSAWALVTAIGIGALALGGVVVQRRRAALPWVAAGLALGAIVSVAYFVETVQMPEGGRLALLTQLYDLGFLLAPAMTVLAVLWLLRRLRSPESLNPPDIQWIGVIVFACCMYFLLYPRIDSMHLIVALPSAIVLAAIVVRRMATTWSDVLRIDRAWLVAFATALVAVVATAVAGPNLVAVLWQPQVSIASERLPVHVDAGRSTDARALDALLAYAHARLAPEETVFGFPAMGLVTFALGRQSPVRFEYFFPGRPDHRDEVQVVHVLARTRPRFVVTLNRRLAYFFESPVYYFILRPYVRQHYRLVARFGRFDLLERGAGRRPRQPPVVAFDDAPVPADAAGVLAQLADPDRELRRAAVRSILARAGDAPLDRVADTLTPDLPHRLLLVRNLGEAGDGRVLRFVAEEHDRARSPRMVGDTGQALLLLALRDTLAPRLLAHVDRGFGRAAWRTLPLAELHQAVASDEGRSDLGLFAPYAFAAAGYREAVPLLQSRLAHRAELDRIVIGLWVRAAVSEALVRLGRPEHLCDLVELLAEQKHEVQDLMPSTLIAGVRRYPGWGATCLARGLVAPEPLEREVSAYVAGAAAAVGVVPTLRTLLDDPDPAVRLAAVWALGRLHEPDDRPALERLARSEDPEMRDVAAQALRRCATVAPAVR